MQQVIKASFDEMDYEIIVPKIEPGACYEIMNFRNNKKETIEAGACSHFKVYAKRNNLLRQIMQILARN